MIAMLGMYDRAEISGANDAFWASIRAKLGFGPINLTRDMDFWEIWQSPELLFAQTCGLPYRSKLHGKVQLVGTPDYGVSGCPAGYYHSVIVARREAGVDLKELGSLRLAYNETNSQSGWAAFWAHVPEGSAVKEKLASGSHLNSARMVASGKADIACVDAVTWELIGAYDSFAADLTVLESTAPTPGLPFVTSLTQDAEVIRRAVREAIDELKPEQRKFLGLKSLIDVPSSTYLALPLPPQR